MKNAIYEESKQGFTISIEPDLYPESPYDMWDHLGEIHHWHKNGFTGESIRHWDREDIEAHFNKIIKEGGIALPLYLYEHGGQTIKTSPFSCPWDSGQVGFVSATRESILKWYGKKRLTKKIKAWAKEIIESEIKSLDDYLTGNVYAFKIYDPQGEIVDSCSGYFGDYDSEHGALSDARNNVDIYIKQAKRHKENRLKVLIRNRVPLEKRALELTA